MNEGLEGVVAARTLLSDVDGAAGRLVLRGQSLDALAGRWRFEQVLALLWDGFFDVPVEAHAMPPALGRARLEAAALLRPEDAQALAALAPVDALRALLARLPDGDDLPTALRLVAATGVFTAAVLRWRAGGSALAPQADAPHAADVLRLAQGRAPTAQQAAALDTYLVTVADHGLNASTFAARVVASTGAGLASAAVLQRHPPEPVRYRRRLRAGLDRLPLPRTRLARRIPEPRPSARETAAASELRRHAAGLRRTCPAAKAPWGAFHFCELDFVSPIGLQRPSSLRHQLSIR